LARINLGQLALISGDLQEARRLYEKRLQACEQINNLWGIAQSYKGLGGVALEQRDFPDVRKYAQRSWMLYQRMQDRDGMADCLLILCQAAYETGDSSSALRYLDQAEELIRATGNGFREVNALVQRAKLLCLEGKNI
jgi:tetratricopeptide (TPR) repeat protein